MPSYPVEEDIIYEIKSFLLKEGKPDREFSHQNLRSIFGNDFENKESGIIFKNLVQTGIIIEKNKGNQGKSWYRIIK